MEMTGLRFCQRAGALLEVLGIFAGTHVLLKVFKQMTALGVLERGAGFNFSPGLFFGGAAVLVLLVTRRDFRLYGLGMPGVRNLAAWIFAVVAAVLYVFPLLAFLHFDPEPWHGFLKYAGFVLAVAVGEEVFFRGYMQSRLNGVFGRPWRVWGVSFGAGLVVASLVFGVLHGLNTVDYFHGHFHFAWGWAALTVVTGMLFGVIREATESVWPAVVVHGLLDVWVIALLGIY